MLKKFITNIVLMALPIFAIAQPKQINDFESLMKALNSGEHVSVVIHYAKCQLISDNEIETDIPDAIGGLSIDTYEYFAARALRYNEKALVVFSENKLIQNPKGNGYKYNYAKIKIEDDGAAKITVSYVDPITFEETMTENFFTTINNGKNEGAMFLYLVR